ncbi:MAG: hypothetical protein ABSE13_09820 [Methanoregula sp.]
MPGMFRSAEGAGNLPFLRTRTTTAAAVRITSAMIRYTSRESGTGGKTAMMDPLL